MKTKAFLFILVVLTAIMSSEVLYSQNYPQPVPDPQVINPPHDWLLEVLFNNKFRIGGIEAGTSTYGYSVGLPVLWAADQLKIVPTLGWFWQGPTDWAGQAAIGGRVLYYLNKQAGLPKGNMNPYVGGFSVMQEGAGYHNSGVGGVAIGIQPHLSRYLKLGFEIQAGLRPENGEDRAFGGAAITIGFGW